MDAAGPSSSPSPADDVATAAAAPVSSPPPHPHVPECYFIVHNIAKKHNVGTIARCATAFGVKSVVLIGSKSYNTFGCKGASNHVDFVHYPTLADARDALKRDLGVTKILGVEIIEGAEPIESHPFDGPTAFITGNEGDGLSDRQKAICDGFVYIRQFGPGTASLNVAVSASIVMHHFAQWAGYQERARVGEKYVVAERPAGFRTNKRGQIGDDPEEVRRRRAAKREAAAREAAGEGDGEGDGVTPALDL